MSGRLIQVSKTLSYLLRHGAVKEGLAISKDGFVSIDDMMQHTRFTKESILEVVKSNDKQRFAVQEIDGKVFIRANQGHSIAVDDLELKKVTSAVEIPTVVHGTYRKSWSVIKNDGLSRMNRNHIHFASGLPGGEGVISGMRMTAEVLVYINAEKAMKDGIEFFTSANGVILTAGNSKGYLEPKYFEQVVDSKGRILDLPLSTQTTTSKEGKLLNQTTTSKGRNLPNQVTTSEAGNSTDQTSTSAEEKGENSSKKGKSKRKYSRKKKTDAAKGEAEAEAEAEVEPDKEK